MRAVKTASAAAPPPAAAAAAAAAARTRRRSPATSPRFSRGQSRSPSLPPVRGASRSPSVGQNANQSPPRGSSSSSSSSRSRSSGGAKGASISSFIVSTRKAVGGVSPQRQQQQRHAYASKWSRPAEQEEPQEDDLLAAARVLQHPALGYDYDELTRKIAAVARGRQRQPADAHSASALSRVDSEPIPMTVSFALMQCLVRFQPPNVAAFVRVWERASEQQRSAMHREALLLPRPQNADAYRRDITPEVVDVMAQGFEFAARQGLDKSSTSDGRATSHAQLPPVVVGGGVVVGGVVVEKHGAYQHAHRELEALDNVLAECRVLHGAVSGELPDGVTAITSTAHCVDTLARLRGCVAAARDAGVPALKKQLRHASTMESLLSGLVPKVSAATKLQAAGRGFLRRLKDAAAREAERVAGEIAAAKHAASLLWHAAEHYQTVARSWEWVLPGTDWEWDSHRDGLVALQEEEGEEADGAGSTLQPEYDWGSYGVQEQMAEDTSNTHEDWVTHSEDNLGGNVDDSAASDQYNQSTPYTQEGGGVEEESMPAASGESRSFWVRLWHPSSPPSSNFAYDFYLFNPITREFCLAEESSSGLVDAQATKEWRWRERAICALQQHVRAFLHSTAPHSSRLLPQGGSSMGFSASLRQAVEATIHLRKEEAAAAAALAAAAAQEERNRVAAEEAAQLAIARDEAARKLQKVFRKRAETGLDLVAVLSAIRPSGKTPVDVLFTWNQFGSKTLRSHTFTELVTFSDLYHLLIDPEMFAELCFPFEVYYFNPDGRLAKISSNRQWLRALRQFLTGQLEDPRRLALNIRQTKIGTPPRRIDFDKNFPGAVPESGGPPRFREWLAHKSWADSSVVAYFHVLTGTMYTKEPHEYAQMQKHGAVLPAYAAGLHSTEAARLRARESEALVPLEIHSCSVVQRFWRSVTSAWRWLRVGKGGIINMYQGEVKATVHGQRLDMSAALGKLRHIIGGIDRKRERRRRKSVHAIELP